jgi:WD40 repeat protein
MLTPSLGPLILGLSPGAAASTHATTLTKSVVLGVLLSKLLKAVVGVVLLLALLAGGTAGLAHPIHAAPAGAATEPASVALPDEAQAARLDLSGDPLPDEALVRLGTTRLRQGNANFLHFAPDGKTLLCWGGNGAPRAFDTTTGKMIAFPLPKFGDWREPSFSPDNKLVAQPRWDSLHIYETATARIVRSLQNQRFTEACFSPDGKTLATHGGMQFNEVTLWETDTGKKLRTWTTGKDRFHSFAFAAGGKLIVTVEPNWIRAWLVDTGKNKFEIPFGNFLAKMAVSPDGKTLAVVPTNERRESGPVYLWDVADPKEPRRLAIPAGWKPAGCLAFAPDGKTLLADCTDRFLYVCDLTGGQQPRRFVEVTAPFSLAFSPDGRVLAISDGATIRLVDAASGKELLPFDGHPGGVDLITMTPDGRTIVTSCGRDIFLWDAGSGRLRRWLRGRHGQPSEIKILDGGRTLVCSVHHYKGICVWDLVKGTDAVTLDLPLQAHIQAVAPDGRTIVLGGANGNVVMMDANTGKVLQTLQAPGGQIYGAAFTSGGRQLAVCYVDDNVIRLWDLSTRKVVREYTISRGTSGAGRVRRPSGSPAYYSAFSPDGRLIALGSELQGAEPRYVMGLLEVLDLATGELLQRVDNLPNPVHSMAFSPDGRMVACADRNGPAVRLIEVATGRERHHFLGKSVRALAFSDDGNALVSGSHDTTAVVWDLTGRLTADKSWGKPLAAAELDACWDALAGDDAPRAFRAIQRLTASAKDAISYLRKHLQPARPLGEQRVITSLIAALDSDDFQTREHATKELEQCEDGALGLFRKALGNNPSPEAKRRLEMLVRKLSDQRWNPAPERRRVLRCLEVLERAGTPEARSVLEVLAKGAQGARLTEETKASLDRLRARSK